MGTLRCGGVVAVVVFVAGTASHAADAPPTHASVHVPLGGTVCLAPPTDAALSTGRRVAVREADAAPRERRRRIAPTAGRTARVVSEAGPTSLGRATTGERVRAGAPVAIERAALGGSPRTVAEPSIGAFQGGGALVLGNSFGALAPPGLPFEPIDPNRLFPSAVGVRLVDPLVLSKPGLDLVVAYVQFRGADDHDGGAALLAATGAELAARRARFYRLSPELFGESGWLDYPDLAFSDGYVHWTALLVGPRPVNEVRSTVWARFPIEALRSGATSLRADWTIPVERASARLAQGCDREMFAAAHASPATLTVFRWPDAQAPTTASVDVDPWLAEAVRWRSAAPASSGRDWLARLGRFGSADITAAWHRRSESGVEVGFAWNVSADDTHPQPHVRAVVLDASLSRTRQPHLWSPDVAFAYPAAGVDRQGRLGFVVAFGGGAHAPGVAVGTERTAGPSAAPPWDLVAAVEGTDSPSSGDWGDFLVVRSVGEVDGQGSFATVAWTLRGGGEDEHVEASLVRFTVR